MIYFASERDGTFNLWRMSSKGGAAQQVTNFKSGGVFFPSISPDGKHIVFQHDFDLYTVDVPSGKPKKLNLALAFDAKDFDVEVLTAQSRAEGFSISPSGEYMAVDYHGEIMIVPTEQGVGEKTQVTNSPWRERAEEYSPDGRKIAYISDEGGEQQVWVYDIARGVAEEADDERRRQGQPHLGAELAEARVSASTTRSSRSTSPAARRASSRRIRPAASPSRSTRPTATGSSTAVATTSRTPRSILYDIKAKKEYNISQSPWNEIERPADARRQDARVRVEPRRRQRISCSRVSLARMTEDPNDPLVRERMRRATRGGRGGRGDACSADTDECCERSDERSPSISRASIGARCSSRAARRRRLVLPVARRTHGVLRRRRRFGGRGGGGGRGAAGGDTSQNGLYSVEHRRARSSSHRGGNVRRHAADGRSSRDVLPRPGARAGRRRAAAGSRRCAASDSRSSG